MLYKAVWIWLAIQIPLGLVVGMMLWRVDVADGAGQDDELDAKAAVAPAEMAMELETG